MIVAPSVLMNKDAVRIPQSLAGSGRSKILLSKLSFQSYRHFPQRHKGHKKCTKSLKDSPVSQALLAAREALRGAPSIPAGQPRHFTAVWHFVFGQMPVKATCVD